MIVIKNYSHFNDTAYQINPLLISYIPTLNTSEYSNYNLMLYVLHTYIYVLFSEIEERDEFMFVLKLYFIALFYI